MDTQRDPARTLARSNLKCDPTTRISPETLIYGDVTIGANCHIARSAKIIAKDGPIVIGKGNIIDERVTIINNRKEPIIIEHYNNFFSDSHCEARKIGSHNTLSSSSKIGPKILLKDKCSIGGNLDSDYTKVITSNSKIGTHFNSDMAREILGRRARREEYLQNRPMPPL